MSGSRRAVFLGVAAAALPALAAALAIAAKGPFHPLIHDEYAYVLAAETFASGRAANPSPAHAEHFEALDTLVRPTRASRKPPLIGLFLILGLAGSVLSVALAAAAIYWALLAWLPPGWAFAGAALAGLHPALFAWSVSFWGGGVGVLGGALAVGAWKRLLDRPAVPAAAALGAGLIILAGSRPFEGLVLAVPLLASLAWRQLRRPRTNLIAPAMALGAVLLAAGAAGVWYNARVTGDAFLSPYTAYERQYGSIPLLAWQSAPPPRTYRNPEFAAYFDGWVRSLESETAAGRAGALGRIWLAPAPFLALAFVAGLGLAPAGPSLLLGAFVLGVVSLSRLPMLAHYSGPGAVLLFLIAALALKRLEELRRGAGRLAAAAAALSSLAALASAYAALPPGAANPCYRVKEDFRARAAASFGPGSRHLVFVRADPRDFTRQGWFYNAADLEGAPVVWARELSPAEDCALAADSPDRTVWRLTVAPPKAGFELLRAAAGGPGPRRWAACGR